MKTFKSFFKVAGWFCVCLVAIFLFILIGDISEYSSYSTYGDVTLLDIYLMSYFLGSAIVGALVCFWLSEFSAIKAKEEEYYDLQLYRYDLQLYGLKQNNQNDQSNQNKIDFKRLSVGDTFTLRDISTQNEKNFTVVEKEKQDESKGLISNDLPIAIKVANYPIGKNIEMKYGDKIYQFKIMDKKQK